VAENFAWWMEWLEATALAASIRQSIWAYPFIEIIHIFGIVLVAGAAGLFDLLVLFYSKKIAAEGTAYLLLTWSKRGLILVVPSGILLFITNAKALGYDATFHLKLILLALAGINAWIFHVTIYVPFVQQKQGTLPWKKAKVNAIFSLLLWMSIISCGRLLAY
jgi:hypothetical protein